MDPRNEHPPDSTQLRELFDALVDLDAEELELRLASLAVPDDLCRQLRTMLAADRAQRLPLGMSVAEAVGQMRDDRSLVERLIGSKIGPFRLLSLIGQGGSSAVFRAERAAGEGAQTVALKLMRSGLFSADSQRHFAREQAILAQLTHPNIARLIEGGVSEAGVPYIAMEYIDGQPITVHADERGLDLAGRLRVFIVLCRAVEAAHATLVVHCDLKPSNVYVNANGELKVLDFGIAKLLDEDGGATRTLSIMLTPEYAAPEQFKPGPVTTAADVYALGVLLGELLTGKRLGHTTKASASTAVTGDPGLRMPRGLPGCELLSRRLRGDLDAIIATALAEEPLRRYRSAGELAADIDRYLAGQPVTAHPPSRWYRTHKFVTRHRGGVLLTAMLTVGIIASLVIAVWQSVVAQREAAEAHAQAARADSMRDFMFDAFADAEPSTPRNGPATIIDAVERAITTVSAQRDTEPRARIELLIQLAKVMQAQGRLDRAAEILASAKQQAEHEFGADDLLSLQVELAAIDVEGIRGHYAQALQRSDKILARLPADAIALRAEALTHAAWVASVIHDRDRGLRDAKLAVELARRLGHEHLIQQALRAQGSVQLAFDQIPAAIQTYEEVLALQRARFGDTHVRVAAEEAALSRAYRRNGDLEPAEAHARAALAIDEKAYVGDHYYKSVHWNALTMVLIERRAFDQALASETESRRIALTAVGADHTDVLMATGTIGRLHGYLGDWNRAASLIRSALEGMLARSSSNPWTAIRMRMNLGFALAMSGRRDEGQAELGRALADAQKAADPDQDVIAMILEKQTRIALDFDDPKSALLSIDRAAAIVRSLPPKPYWQGRIDTLRAEALLALGRNAETAEALDQAADELAKAKHPDLVVSVADDLLRAILARSMGDAAHAQSTAQQARERLRTLPFPPPHLTHLAAKLPE